ncbi:unnamed protein product [Arabis nemorensis]|uniref:MATH domain-containing protein n=1 Tax=Arabis nemorensis TaxID=586526 RepID=A0A565BNA8_9BRAS|nr:unnamed protein product [Arabis nemorensis]
MMMMETELQKSFTWMIDNFSERKSPMRSTLFSSGGYEWYVLLHPKGEDVNGYLSLYLCVANPKSLQPGWKRRVNMRFVISNQSGKEIHRTSEGSELFRAEIPGWGFRKAMRLSKLQDKELLENNTLMIEVYTNVTEVVHKGVETGNEFVDFRGFRVLSSQVISLSRIFAKHPNFAVDIKPRSRVIKTAFINTLLDLIEALERPPESFSKIELDTVYNRWVDLMDKGFKVDWLKSKLDNVWLEWKKKNEDAVRIQELEENVKNLKMVCMERKIELDKEKDKSSTASKENLWLEKTVSDLKVELEKEKAIYDARASWFREKLFDLIEELNKEKAKSDTKPKVLWLEKTVSDLKVELDKEKAISSKARERVSWLEKAVSNLKVKLEKEKAKSDTKPDDVSLLEKTLLEKTVSDLKVEVEKEKAKSSAKTSWLEKKVSDLKGELDKEKAKSATKPRVWSFEKAVESDFEDNEKSDTEPNVFPLGENISFRRLQSFGIRRRRLR